MGISDGYQRSRASFNKRRAVAFSLFLAPAVCIQHVQAAESSAATSESKDEKLEEVVVTGIRASLRDALDAKRDAIQVVDAISAEDVGKFPDKNLGEALQRITGVQISRQDGEGRGVSIRGAEPGLNRVEINGVTALSLTVGGGRDVDFRDLPVEFVSRLEVYKSATPEMTEGGVGGTVRVVTRRPLDTPEGYLAGSSQAVYSNLADSFDPKLALIGSKTFFDNRLGVLVAGSWEQRTLDSHNARTTGWLKREPNPNGTATPAGRLTDVNFDGTYDWIPEIPRYVIDRRETDRAAVMSIVEWQATDSLKLFAEGTYARGKEEVNSTFMQLGAAAGVIDYANSRVGAGNTVTHLEVTSTAAFPIDLVFRNILGGLEREQYTTAVGANWEIGSFKLDGRVTYADAEVQNDEINSTATIFGVPRAIVDYNGGGAPNFTFPGIDVTSGDAVNNLAAIFNPRTNTQDETSAQFNVEFLPSSTWLTSIKTGADVRKVTMDSLFYQRTIQLSSRTPTPASTGATTTVAVPQSVIANIVNTYSRTNPIGFFETGDLGIGGGIRYWNDNGNATYLQTIAASGLTMNPYGTNSNVNTNGSFQNFLDTWNVEEKTNAAYVQGSFKFEELAVPISGTLGVRYVDTDTNSAGFNRIQTAQGVTFPRGERGGGYTKWLPSLNLKFDLSDDIVGRMTAGKVLARPNPSQMALRRSLDAVGFTGSRGNPDLKPYEATQYDLGLEWYFGETNFLSAALFRKEISSFITTVAFREEADGSPGDGSGDDYTVTQPINGTDEVTINGIEAGAQYAFDFLPAPFNGFGVLANVTYQKDEGYDKPNVITKEIMPFPGLSRLSYNYALYYENERFSVRGSYNWREKWLINPTGRGSLPEYNDDFGSLDASVSVNILPDVSVFFEAINLLDEDRIEYINQFRLIGHETYGSRYFLGVRAKL